MVPIFEPLLYQIVVFFWKFSVFQEGFSPSTSLLLPLYVLKYLWNKQLRNHWDLCAAGALSFAELGMVVPKSGGHFSFYVAAFSDLHKFWGPLPSFIYSFLSILFVRPAEIAIMTLTFAEYTIRPISIWTSMTEDTEYTLVKITSILALGKVHLCPIRYHGPL